MIYCDTEYKKDYIYYRDPKTNDLIKKDVIKGSFCQNMKDTCLEHSPNTQLMCQRWYNDFCEWCNDGISNIDEFPYALQWNLYKYFVNIILFNPKNYDNSNIYIYNEADFAEIYVKSNGENNSKWVPITCNPPFSLSKKYNLRSALEQIGYLNKYILPYKIYDSQQKI